jgi:hypothetical protein
MRYPKIRDVSFVGRLRKHPKRLREHFLKVPYVVGGVSIVAALVVTARVGTSTAPCTPAGTGPVASFKARFLEEAFGSQRGVRRFVTSMKELCRSGDEDVAVGPASSTTNSGNLVISTPFRSTMSTDEIAGFNPNAGVLWPGALIQGGSAANGTLADLAPKRAAISLGLYGAGPEEEKALLAAVVSPAPPAQPALASTPFTTNRVPIVSAVINEPTAAKVEQERLKMLSGGFSTSPKFSFIKKQFFSLDHAFLQVGASASWVGGNARLNLESDKYSTQTNLIAKLTEEYYTLSVTSPSTPVGFFGKGVRIRDLVPYSDTTNNPILFVRSVTYGRMALLLVSSSESYDKLVTSIEATVSAAMSTGSINTSSADYKVVQQSEVRLWVHGGPQPDQTINFVGDKVGALTAYFRSSTWKDAKWGRPISYRLDYLKNNNAAQVEFTTNYTRVERSELPQIKDPRISFRTNNDDKDGNTRLTVAIVKKDGSVISSKEVGVGSRFGDNSDSPVYDLSLSRPLLQTDVSDSYIRVCIDPDGSDVWRFGYTLTGVKTGGTRYEQSNPNLLLSEGFRCLQHPLSAY